MCVCLQRVNPEGFKKVTEVAKAGAIKWGALTPEEKKPYEEDAAQRKVRACVCVHMHVCHIVRVAAYDSSSSYSDQTTLRFPVPRPRENCMCEWRALTTPLHVHACVCVCVCVCVSLPIRNPVGIPQDAPGSNPAQAQGECEGRQEDEESEKGERPERAKEATLRLPPLHERFQGRVHGTWRESVCVCVSIYPSSQWWW